MAHLHLNLHDYLDTSIDDYVNFNHKFLEDIKEIRFDGASTEANNKIVYWFETKVDMGGMLLNKTLFTIEVRRFDYGFRMELDIYTPDNDRKALLNQTFHYGNYQSREATRYMVKETFNDWVVLYTNIINIFVNKK